MSKHYIVLLLVALIATTNAYKYIADITVDVQSGQIYVAQGNKLYEVDNVAIAENAVHNLPFAGDTDTGSLFVMRRGNKRSLYTFLESATADKLAYLKVPIGNQATLPAQSSVNIPNGLSLSVTYDASDHIGILSVSRNLTLVNLNNLAVRDTFEYWIGSRIFGRNVVYNHNNQHVIIFKTFVPYSGSYGLSVEEFSIATNEFVSVPTHYNCECDTNPTASPFYKVVFPEGNGCEIDYTAAKPTIYCAAPDQKQVFTFQANNLGIFNVINIAKKFASIAWDFPNHVGFAIDGNSDDEDVVGFKIHKFDLTTGAVLKSHNTNATSIDSYTYKLDPSQPHLYIAVANYDDAEPTEIVSIDTITLAVTIATLTP